MINFFTIDCIYNAGCQKLAESFNRRLQYQNNNRNKEIRQNGAIVYGNDNFKVINYFKIISSIANDNLQQDFPIRIAVNT